MLITHRNFEIEIGLAQKTVDGDFVTPWAAYKRPRKAGDGPTLAGTTITFSDPEMAEAMAHADSRNAVNDLG